MSLVRSPHASLPYTYGLRTDSGGCIFSGELAPDPLNASALRGEVRTNVVYPCCALASAMSWPRHCTPDCKDVPGQSWDAPHEILRTSNHPSLQGCPRTVLGCPSWDPLDIMSPQLARMSKDSTGMSHMGSSGHQVNPACKDVPGQSWDVPHGILRTSSHPSLQCKDVPGQSWDVPHEILRTSSHPSLQGCARTVLGCPS